MLKLLLYNCWPFAILKGGTTCQPASLVESKIYVIWHTHILRRCPLFSTYPTRTISATNVMNSLQFTECPLTGLDPCSRHDSKHAFIQTCNGIRDDDVIAYVQVMR